MKNIFTFILLTLCIQNIFSQIYIPIDTTNLEIRKQASKLFLTNEKQFYKDLTANYKGGERIMIKRKYDNINKTFNEDILKGQFIFEERFDKIIGNIVAELKANNPSIPSDLKFYISRNLPLNASNFGNKSFEINLGAFYYLVSARKLTVFI